MQTESRHGASSPQWQVAFIFEAFIDPSLDVILAWEEGA